MSDKPTDPFDYCDPQMLEELAGATEDSLDDMDSDWEKFLDGFRDLILAKVPAQATRIVLVSAACLALKELLSKEAFDKKLESYSKEKERLAVIRSVAATLGEIARHDNPALTADCIAISAGIHIREGITETDLAKKYGITKQAVSRRVTELRERLDLPAARGLKSDDARRAYRDAQKERYDLAKEIGNANTKEEFSNIKAKLAAMKIKKQTTK